MKTATVIAILCLGSAAARDLDGDGVEDAAAEGDCCAGFYGADLVDCGGATTLAEAQAAGCCGSGSLLRYNIGSDGVEDQTQIDCISFVAEADCTGIWFSKAAGINCPHTIPTPPPSPTGGLNRDLDGDGYEDAAPAGECCTNGGYGNSFAENGYGCGTTLAEVQASGCCQAGFLLRYSLQPGREDPKYWDCVSFVDKAGCAAKGPHYIWSADGMGPGSCPHTVAEAEALGSDSALGSGPLLATAVLATAAAAL